MTDGNGTGDTVPWSRFLDETESRLGEATHVDDPRVEARWLLEEVTGAAGADFSDALGDLATVRGVAHLDRLVTRRLGGEPIQYVLGHWAFRALDLFIDDRVLIPRPETEVVAGLAIDELDRQRPTGPGTVVDLGTGSGAIGLSVAKERPGTRVVLTDRSEPALAVARANLAGLGIIGSSVEILAGSWYDALPEKLLGECDVVVSNPPYVTDDAPLPTAVADWEPATALRAGPDGLADLRQIVAGARPWLRPGGALVVEIDPGQSGAVTAIAEAEGFAVEVHPDLAGHDRVVVARTGRR